MSDTKNILRPFESYLDEVARENKTLNVVEFFAGSRSVGRAAEGLGMNVFSIDWQKFEGINLAADVEFITTDMIPFVPDVVWGSPDCTTYTIAAISYHRNGIEPKSDYAKKCDRVNQNFINLIKQWLIINPDLKFYIENPRGMMRKMPFMQEFERATVWYCTYGDTRAKPTDIWSNNIYSLEKPEGWRPRPQCHNGNKSCHHESAPRGSKTGTQGKKGSYERSKIPEQLCLEILQSCWYSCFDEILRPKQKKVVIESMRRMCEDAFKAQKEMCAEHAKTKIEEVYVGDICESGSLYRKVAVIDKSSIIDCPTPFYNQ